METLGMPIAKCSGGSVIYYEKKRHSIKLNVAYAYENLTSWKTVLRVRIQS